MEHESNLIPRKASSEETPIEANASLAHLRKEDELIYRPEFLTPEEEATYRHLEDVARERAWTDREQLAYRIITTKFKHLAERDRLTGLKKRDELDKEIERERRNPDYRQPENSVVFFIDINDFKQFNTDYGHQNGDQVIQTIAEQIGVGFQREDGVSSTEETSTLTRKSDVAVRYAGDEICLVAYDVKPGGAEVIARRIYEAVANHELKLKNQKTGETEEVKLSVSIGAAPVAETLEASIDRADQWLYEAKKYKESDYATIMIDPSLRQPEEQYEVEEGHASDSPR